MKTSFFVPFLFTETYFSPIFPRRTGINKSESVPAQKSFIEITLPSIFSSIFSSVIHLQKHLFVKQNAVPSTENTQIPKTCVLFWLGKHA